MAKWNKSKVLSENINSGNEFTPNDNLTVEELNAIVNNSFYGVDFVEGFTETPDVSEANNVGTANVSLVPYTKDGRTLYKFKFSNLKGLQGEQGLQGKEGLQGIQGIQGIQGETGETGKDALVYSENLRLSFDPTNEYTISLNKGNFNRDAEVNDVCPVFAELPAENNNGVNKSYIILCKYTGQTSGTSYYRFDIISVIDTTGDSIELRYSDNYIQWKPTHSDTWNNLIAISDLTGLSNYALLTGGNTFNGNQIVMGASSGDVFVVKREGSSGQTVLANGTSYLESSDGKASYQTPTSITLDNENGVYVVNYPTKAGTLALEKSDIFNGSTFTLLDNTKSYYETTKKNFNGASVYYARFGINSSKVTELFNLLQNRNSDIYNCVINITSKYGSYTATTKTITSLKYVKDSNIDSELLYSVKLYHGTSTQVGSIVLQLTKTNSYLYCYLPPTDTSNSYLGSQYSHYITLTLSELMA